MPDADGHVDIPASWTTIHTYAFSGCSELVSISIPDTVTTIDTCTCAQTLDSFINPSTLIKMKPRRVSPKRHPEPHLELAGERHSLKFQAQRALPRVQ